MLARIRKSIDEKEEGFTLIELLVVIIIIGILAAIAIPVFLNQRQKGWDAAIKSDLKNAATAEETVLTDGGAYTDVIATLQTAGFKYSAAANYTAPAVITATFKGGEGYCLLATSASAQVWVYDSRLGGLQPKTTVTCPAFV
ncbi:prepilin-type N-terminal cleavage/methylation domain-containing protein [Pengzhenrongella phosphoraccumulans]|uniref:prepilin-type N-terminal cleavage/methylation domain-containing protein n=1 Tax=Pengzhenrongella phosphoraccumulans TaxID=3114394 RepID=UPI00388DE1EA